MTQIPVNSESVQTHVGEFPGEENSAYHIFVNVLWGEIGGGDGSGGQISLTLSALWGSSLSLQYLE